MSYYCIIDKKSKTIYIGTTAVALSWDHSAAIMTRQQILACKLEGWTIHGLEYLSSRDRLSVLPV